MIKGKSSLIKLIYKGVFIETESLGLYYSGHSAPQIESLLQQNLLTSRASVRNAAFPLGSFGMLAF